MANGFFQGGFAEGAATGQELAQGDRRIGLFERRQQFDEDQALTARTDEAVGNTLKIVSQTIEQAKAAGASPEKIRALIAPLMADVNELTAGSGRDPSRFTNAVETAINTPVQTEPTPEQELEQKLQMEALEIKRRKELGLPVKGEKGDSGKPLPAEVAGRVGAIKVGIDSFPQITELVNQWGDVGSEQNIKAMSEWATGTGNVNKANILVTQAIEGVLRALTGAAAPEQEVARLRGLWMPTPVDRRSTRKLKLDLLQSTLTSMADAIQRNRVEIIPMDEAVSRLENAISQVAVEQPDAAGLPQGVTEEDIRFTMQKHGVSREQVLERLGNAP